MDMQLLYWHWLVLGLILIIAEIFIPSFTIMWFGLGAIIVGLISLAVDMSFNWQVLLWTVSSVAFTVLWFLVIKPKITDRNFEGLAKESAIGESGQVIKVPTETSNGRMRFTTAVLGCDEWAFSCDMEVALGDRLHIKEIAGDVLIVTKLT
jgi:membrane protein implicated in regulation of membrane protease activity